MRARRPAGLIVLLLVTIAASAVLAPASPVAAAHGVPKVALIVGPVGDLTSRYRALAREAAAEARAAGAHVVEVYSPNATWPAVRRAIQGASIVVYLGHGNGWPSRYRDALYPPTQNGFGLNPVAGAGDRAHQYFGESSVDDVRLAKHAVVLLHHLCYASGNTEPGLPVGTVAQSIQRVDNYAAGFRRAGADAVVAEGHLGPAYYVRALLRTSQSIEQIWNRSPTAHGNTMRIKSVRSPGFTERLDPDRRGEGFYRSLVSRGVSAAQVRGSAPTPGRDRTTAAAPPPASLAGTGVAFGHLKFASLPISGKQTRLVLPLSAGTKSAIPKGAQVGLRWDPILVASQPPPGPDPGTAGNAASTATTGASTATNGTAGVAPASASPDPGAASPASGGAPVASSETAAVPPPSSAASPSIASTAALGSPGAAPVGPGASPDPASVVQPPPAADPPVVVDMIQPEQLGTVVDVVPTKRLKAGLAVRLTYPTQPGLYRLVPTLHEADGDAFDAATQDLLTPVIVRVSGPISVAYGIAPGTTMAPGMQGSVRVHLLNAGSQPWEKRFENGFLTRLPATLVATWVSVPGAVVPPPIHQLLDPALSSPGSGTDVTIDLVAPAVPGEYIVLLDVISPGRGPLTALGNEPGLVRVTVRDPGASAGGELPLVTPSPGGSPGAASSGVSAGSPPASAAPAPSASPAGDVPATPPPSPTPAAP